MAGKCNGGYWDMMEVAWVGRGGGQSQGGAWVHAGDMQSMWGQAKGRGVEHGAPKGRLWAAVRAQ